MLPLWHCYQRWYYCLSPLQTAETASNEFYYSNIQTFEICFLRDTLHPTLIKPGCIGTYRATISDHLSKAKNPTAF